MKELTDEEKRAYNQEIQERVWNGDETVTDEEQETSVQYWYDLHKQPED